MKLIELLVFLAASSPVFGNSLGTAVIQDGICNPEDVEDPVVLTKTAPYCVLKGECRANRTTYFVTTGCPVSTNGECTKNLKQCDREGTGYSTVLALDSASIASPSPAVSKKNIPSKPFITYEIIYTNLDAEDAKLGKKATFTKSVVQCLGRIDPKSVPSSMYPHPFATCNLVKGLVNGKTDDLCPAPEDCLAKRLDTVQTPPYAGASTVHAGQAEDTSTAADPMQRHKRK
jgi:hypothetical protein